MTMMFGFRAGFIAASAVLLQPGQHRPAVYIAPNPQGDQSGSSWANAAPLSAIDKMAAKAAQLGGDVLLRADLGNYVNNVALRIGHGGTAKNPVMIRGVDVNGNDMPAVITGSRARPWKIGSANGQEVFRLIGGADHLVFRFITGKDQGKGVIRIAAPITDLTMESVTGDNVQAFVDNTATAPWVDATCTGFTMRGSSADGYSKYFCRMRYSSGPGLMEDCRGDSQEQDGDNFAAGCVLDGSFGGFNLDGSPNGCHDWIYRRCSMGNHRDTLNSYQNGDGFSSEGQDYNTYYEDCYSWSNSDGGFDCKAKNTRFLRCRGYDNKRNWRIWGDAVAIDCIAQSPNKRGGIGAPCQIGTFHTGYFRWYGGSMTQTAGTTVIKAEDGGATFFTARTEISYPDSAAFQIAEVNSIIATIDETDTAAPVLQQSSYSYKDLNGTHVVAIGPDGRYSVAENKTISALIQTNEPCALRILPTPGRAPDFIFTGTQVWTMPAKDYENDTSGHNETYSATMRLLDGNGNSSDWPLVATITDVDDNPIGPQDLLNSGLKNGAWWEIRDKSTLFLDLAGSVPVSQWADDGDPQVFRVKDKLGFGNDLVAADANSGFYLRSDPNGQTWWLEPMTATSHFLVPGKNSLAFPVVTAIMCIYREPDETQTSVLVSVPRGPVGTSSNGSWWMSVSGGQSLGMRYLTQGSSSSFTSKATGSGNYAIVGAALVLTLQTARGLERSNAVDAQQTTGNSGMTYPRGAAGLQARVLADGNDGQLFTGRFYGGYIGNRDEADDIRFRIERQFGGMAQLNL